MPTPTPFDWAESRGTSVRLEPRLDRAQFGDGYEQVAPAGINHIKESWELSFAGVDDQVGQEIIDYIAARGGHERFEWTPLWSVTPIRVRCPKWSRTLEMWRESGMALTFERVYEP